MPVNLLSDSLNKFTMSDTGSDMKSENDQTDHCAFAASFLDEYDSIQKSLGNPGFQQTFRMMSQGGLNTPEINETPVSYTDLLPTSLANPLQTYRDNPAIDETTTMPFGGNMMHLHSEMTMAGEDTSYMPTYSLQSHVSSHGDANTISTLLNSSERIQIRDEDYNTANSSFHLKTDYESPMKLSRVDGENVLDMDKLFDAKDGEGDKDNFKFQKFGLDVNSSHSNISSSATSTLNTSSASSSFAMSGNVHDQNVLMGMHPPTSEGYMVSHNTQSGYDQHHSPVHQQNHSPVHQQQNMSPTYNNMDNTQSHLPSLSGGEMKISEHNHSVYVPLQRLPPLSQNFPDRHGGVQLKILKQPEAQHRARYMTEGSRGAIKDTLQQGHPLIQLIGWDQPVLLDVFIGNDAGKAKPHSFYQACRISGKNASVSRERTVDGTVVIEMELDPTKKMIATVDCVGILKLRNTDVEKRIGVLKSKKKSTKCRLIFRVNLLQPDGTIVTLQVPSAPIACTQPAGQPEICRMSLNSATTSGGHQLFVIGKNFIKGFQVKFQQIQKGTGEIIWESEAEVDQEFTHNTHFICTVPSYKADFIDGVVSVQLVVETSAGISDPISFKYLSASSAAAEDVPAMSSCDSGIASKSNSNSVESSPHSIVSPEALDMVAQIQQQHYSDKDSKIFQIPNGIDFISQDGNSRMSMHHQ